MHESEEHHEWSTLQSWLFIVGLSSSLFLVMMILMMIKEMPRDWDFGTLPFTPSESVYSTSKPDKIPDERMIEALPDK